jgi:hypothetical protein
MRLGLDGVEDMSSRSSSCSSDMDSVFGSDRDASRQYRDDDSKGIEGDRSCGVGLALRLVIRGQSAGPAVVVEWVVPGGAAALSGVIKAGDVLLSVREAEGLVNIINLLSSVAHDKKR